MPLRFAPNGTLACLLAIVGSASTGCRSKPASPASAPAPAAEPADARVDPMAQLEASLAEAMSAQETIARIDELAGFDDTVRIRLLERAAELLDGRDPRADAIRTDHVRAAALYERILLVRPYDLGVYDLLIECHRGGTEDVEALADAVLRKAALLDDPSERQRLVDYVVELRELAAQAGEERADSNVRFSPGGPPEQARMERGFHGAGIYAVGDEGRLVLLRTDGEYAPVSLLRPVANVDNRWRFELPGKKLALDDPRLESATKLPHEGFYRLRQEMHFSEEGHWISGAIVQLGYTRDADPIVFIAQKSESPGNVLFFSDKGVEIRRDQLRYLEPLAWYQEDSEDYPTDAPAEE